MAHEGGIIARWLRKVLEEDEALTELGLGEGKVWRRSPPGGAPIPVPYIVFAMEPGSADENAAGARHRAITRHSVRVYTDDSTEMDDIDPVLNRIEEILDHATPETEGYLLTVSGAGMVEGDEAATGRELRFQGRVWQISAERIGEDL